MLSIMTVMTRKKI